jgi:integrase
LVRISRFARRRGNLPEDKISEAEKVPKIKPGHDIVTWAPAEAKLLLETVSPKWLPCEVLGLFAGLRRSEIWRLEWSAFKWDQRDRNGEAAPIIAVMRKIARKIRVDRLVPILPNLVTWLEPYRDRVGPLYPAAFKTNENAHSIEMSRIRAITGLTRKDNANRHSFGSYRLAIVKSFDQVALEMGTSNRKIRENYNDPKSELEAMQYFALSAPRLDNVIPLSLALEFH